MNEVMTMGWPQMTSPGEALLFWSTAVIMVAAAFGVLLFRKAAYSALCMVVMMLGMAVLFFALQAPFNGAVQVIVYTGAIMMLFLFVIMMIGLGASDGFREQRKGYIAFAGLLGAALAIFGVGVVLASTVQGPGGIDADPYSNAPVTLLASALFQNHWLTIQLAACLLIIAAVGAVLLTHSDRLSVKFNQRVTAQARMSEYAARGAHVGQQPAPGVYALSNAVDNPAIAGDTLEPAEESVPRVLRLRGLERPIGAVSPDVAESLMLARAGRRDKTIWATKPMVQQSKAWGMPGADAPTGLLQMRGSDLERTQAAEPDALRTDADSSDDKKEEAK